LLALAGTDQESDVAGVDVGEVEAGQFQTAEAGGVEHFQEGPIAQAFGGAGVGLGEDGFDVLDREQGVGELPGLFGQDPFGGGVVKTVPFARQPAEEALERVEQDVLGAGGRGWPSLLRASRRWRW
jgi:hypothetical protein